MPVSNSKQDAREAWIRRLQIYWTKFSPRFNTRIGEIYEVDFGENPGSEFSGRHLAICLSNTMPSQERFLVIPLTTKFETYNIAKEDLIATPAANVDFEIKAGAVLSEARWISKIRVFTVSKILNEDESVLNPVKGNIEVSNSQLKRWKSL